MSITTAQQLKALYQLRLRQWYLAEAQRMVNKATVLEDKYVDNQPPKLRIV